MNIADVAAMLSAPPWVAEQAARMQELEIAAARRAHEEQIASALGVPADLLFNPLVQRLLADPIKLSKRFDVRPMTVMRRKVRKTYGL